MLQNGGNVAVLGEETSTQSGYGIHIKTIGGPKNPLLTLVDEGTKGRTQVILSGHCPDCDNSLKNCKC